MIRKIEKRVLIVDDEPRMREVLADNFEDCNEDKDCEYNFIVDMASSAAECIAKIRDANYDVIVLDIRMEEETSGLATAQAFRLSEMAKAINKEFGPELPIRIIFTGYPQYPQCVEVMRSGAWDYIVKEDVGEKSMFKIVVDSALVRLRQLDLRRKHEELFASDWVPKHIHELQKQYGGKLVALWHQPQPEVIAAGIDAFDLEEKLINWRNEHEEWEQPFIVKIPASDEDR